jgi:hypothetical protein
MCMLNPHPAPHTRARATDAIMHRRGMGPRDMSSVAKHLNRTLTVSGAHLAPRVTEIVVENPVHCDPDVIQQLATHVRRFRVVALVLFILDDSELVFYRRLMGPQPHDACRASGWKVGCAL